MAKPSLNLVLLSAVLLASPIASAQSGTSTTTTDTTAGPMGGGRRHHGNWNGQHHHSNTPTRTDVMSLSSLTPSQKQDIETIYKQAHQTMRPLIAQLRQQGGPEAGAGNTGTPGGASNTAGGPGGNPQRADLIRQIKEQRRSTWESVKAKLTPDQITQLEQQVTNRQQQTAPNQ